MTITQIDPKQQHRERIPNTDETRRILQPFDSVEELNENTKEIRKIFKGKLKPASIKVLDLLHKWSCKYPGVCYLSKNKMTEKLGLSRQTIITACKDLETMGIVEQYETRRSGGDQRQSTNLIVFVKSEDLTPDSIPQLDPKDALINSLKNSLSSFNTYVTGVSDIQKIFDVFSRLEKEVEKVREEIEGIEQVKEPKPKHEPEQKPEDDDDDDTPDIPNDVPKEKEHAQEHEKEPVPVPDPHAKNALKSSLPDGWYEMVAPYSADQKELYEITGTLFKGKFGTNIRVEEHVEKFGEVLRLAWVRLKNGRIKASKWHAYLFTAFRRTARALERSEKAAPFVHEFRKRISPDYVPPNEDPKVDASMDAYANIMFS